MQMSSIKSLHIGVRNSMRSSIVLFDLPRVVEELTYNSMDSGATKVYVSINVQACYVKVEDNGCGITRDGLVILGERYATSKIHHLTGTETNGESLGFRGESLASLSDVSLVEIRTKARGAPNAYCKIIKGSNCLFFGIDDQREAVGTTVVVRDLFYNQPVRRNYMQSSPKRVLHSIKKCVLRIALVHPQVLFKVTDISSEDELLCTIPSSSPLPLVSDGFGDEVSSSLQEVVFSDPILMLSGYISGLINLFSTKAFQYIYVNSRFICKGPIHNLLNNLAASFQGSLTRHKAEPEFQSGKRHKTEGYPAFLLDLCCPLSSYDLHFEPSKTVVEFKDWNTILTFFEQAIKRFWEQVSEKPSESPLPSSGNNYAHDDGVPAESVMQDEDMFLTGLSPRYKMRNSGYDMQRHQNITSHGSVTSPLDMTFKDSNADHKHVISSEDVHGFSWLKPCQRKVGSLGEAGSSSQCKVCDSIDDFGSPCAQLGYANNYQECSTDMSCSQLENNLFLNQTPVLEDNYVMSHTKMRNNSRADFGNLRKGDSHTTLDFDPFDIIDNDERIRSPVPYFTACSQKETERSDLLGYEKGHSASYTTHSGFSVGFDHSGNYSPFHDSGDAAQADKDSSIWHANFQEADYDYMPSVSVSRKSKANHAFDVTSNGANEVSFYEENKLRYGLGSDIWVTDSKCKSPEIDWYLGTRRSLPVKKLRKNTKSCNSRALFSPISSVGDDVKVLNSVQSIPDEVCHARYLKTEFEFRYGSSPKRNVQYGSPSNDSNQINEKVSSSLLFNDETGWSPSESCNMKNTEFYSKHVIHSSTQIQDDGNEILWDELHFQNSPISKDQNVRSRRSSSAPPFYKGKHRFSTLNDHLSTIAGNHSTSHSYVSNTAQEGTILSLNGQSQPCYLSQPCLNSNVHKYSPSATRKSVDETVNTHQMDGNKKIGEINRLCYNQSADDNAAEGSVSDELKYALATPTKWRTGIPEPTDRGLTHINNDDVLSILSGLLHLSASSLIPESINKDCLENAKVLLQVDKKFIPVMAGEVLAIIDQHAADERIRLEDLRQKVLSGEGNSVTYLDSEQELVLPEMGYQLLQKYADQIQKWGWICNIHSQCSGSFAKNVNLLKRRRCGITLIAVPCILGIKLSGKDLIEFIEQLVETDGSSTIPPSVHRILNSKACRGAIMFGDSLLPSECSLILEELKATSLCFQCAHGRPTTVPLVDMSSLREQLAVLEMERGGPDETWHSLRRYACSVERAHLRLESAKRFQGG